MSVSPKVSIIILNLDRADLTRDCIKSVIENTEDGFYEIIVVDNGSGVDQVKRLLTPPSSEFSLLRLNRNMFFGEANNIGAERVVGEYIVFLNNDIKVTSGWLPGMLDVFEHNAHVGAVGPKFLSPDGSLQEAGAYILPEGRTLQFGKDEKDLPASYVDGTQAVDYCSAACLLMKRREFLDLGGFDPIFDPAYYEDVDLAIRLRSIGLFSYYCGRAAVFHEGNVTSRRIWTDEIRNSYVAANQRKLVTRWGAYLQRRIDEPCEPDALTPVKWQAEAGSNGKRRIILYSSNPIKASEGARRLLLVACAFQKTHDVIIAANEVISRCRVYSLCREFRIELASFRTRNIADVSESADDLIITFDIECTTSAHFKNQISFERDGHRLLDLFE